MFNGYKVSVREAERVLEIDGYKTLLTYLMSNKCILKNVNFTGRKKNKVKMVNFMLSIF